MPVVTCPNCPTRMKVPDGAKGNTKCPKCATVFPVAAPAASAFEVVDAPPAPPPRPAPVKAAADEEPDFEIVEDDEAPKKRVVAAVEDDDDDEDKPRKKKKKRIEEDDEDDDEPRARKKKRASAKDDDDDEDDEPRKRKKKRAYAEDDDDEDEDDEDDDRPRRKSKKTRGSGGKTLLLFGLLGLLGLALIGGLVWLLWPSGPGGNVRYMPDSAQFVAAVKVEELLGSSAYKQIMAEFPKLEKNFDTSEESFGLALKDISSVMIGGADASGGKDEHVVAIKTNRSVKAADLLAKIKGQKFTEEKVGSYTLHVSGRDHALCVPDSNVVLMGETETLRKVLQRDKDPNFSDAMRAALKEADFSKTIAFAASREQFSKGKNNFTAGIAPGADEVLKNAEGVGGWVEVKSDISWKVSTLYKDGAAADEAKKVFDAFLVLVKKEKNFPAEANQLLDGLETSTSGSRFRAKGTIETAKIVKAIKKFTGGIF